MLTSTMPRSTLFFSGCQFSITRRLFVTSFVCVHIPLSLSNVTTSLRQRILFQTFRHATIYNNGRDVLMGNKLCSCIKPHEEEEQRITRPKRRRGFFQRVKSRVFGGKIIATVEPDLEADIRSVDGAEPFSSNEGTSVDSVEPVTSVDGTEHVPADEGSSVDGVDPVPANEGTSVDVVGPVPADEGSSVDGADPVPANEGTSVDDVGPVPAYTSTPVDVAGPVPTDEAILVNNIKAIDKGTSADGHTYRSDVQTSSSDKVATAFHEKVLSLDRTDLQPQKVETKATDLSPNEADVQDASLPPEKAEVPGRNVPPDQTKLHATDVSKEVRYPNLLSHKAAVSDRKFALDSVKGQAQSLQSNEAEQQGAYLPPGKTKAQSTEMPSDEQEVHLSDLPKENAKVKVTDLSTYESKVLTAYMQEDKTMVLDENMPRDKPKAQALDLLPVGTKVQVENLPLYKVTAQTANLPPLKADTCHTNLPPDKPKPGQDIVMSPDQAVAVDTNNRHEIVDPKKKIVEPEAPSLTERVKVKTAETRSDTMIGNSISMSSLVNVPYTKQTENSAIGSKAVTPKNVPNENIRMVGTGQEEIKLVDVTEDRQSGFYVRRTNDRLIHDVQKLTDKTDGPVLDNDKTSLVGKAGGTPPSNQSDDISNSVPKVPKLSALESITSKSHKNVDKMAKGQRPEVSTEDYQTKAKELAADRKYSVAKVNVKTESSKPRTVELKALTCITASDDKPLTQTDKTTYTSKEIQTSSASTMAAQNIGATQLVNKHVSLPTTSKTVDNANTVSKIMKSENSIETESDPSAKTYTAKRNFPAIDESNLVNITKNTKDPGILIKENNIFETKDKESTKMCKQTLKDEYGKLHKLNLPKKSSDEAFEPFRRLAKMLEASKSGADTASKYSVQEQQPNVSRTERIKTQTITSPRLNRQDKSKILDQLTSSGYGSSNSVAAKTHSLPGIRSTETNDCGLTSTDKAKDLGKLSCECKTSDAIIDKRHRLPIIHNSERDVIDSACPNQVDIEQQLLTYDPESSDGVAVKSESLPQCKEKKLGEVIPDDKMKIVDKPSTFEKAKSKTTVAKTQRLPVIKKKEKVSEFEVPKGNAAPPMKSLKMKPKPKHLHAIPATARADIGSESQKNWTQHDSQSRKAQMPWMSQRPQFDVAFPQPGNTLLQKIGSVEKMVSRRIIPLPRRIEQLKAEFGWFSGRRLFLKDTKKYPGILNLTPSQINLVVEDSSESDDSDGESEQTMSP